MDDMDEQEGGARVEAPVFWAALKAVPELGDRLLCRLLEQYRCPESIFALSEPALAAEGLKRRAVQAILDGSAVESGRAACRQSLDMGLELISLEDYRYPALLKEIYNPPILIYADGNVEHFSRFGIAVIGSRRPSSYGRQMTLRIAAGLAERGVVVVSGMARGLDSMAHRSVLETGGTTIAVLGSGHAMPYPPENRELMRKISENGCVVSEYPPEVPPLKQNFPARNRIISGLSKGVIVVEASEKSGSLITASLALEQGRDVFAVAGNVTSPLSRGTNRLIKAGAVPVEDAEDVLESVLPELVVAPERKSPREEDLTGAEKNIISYIKENGTCQINELCCSLEISVEEALHYLLCLELKSMVRQMPGQHFEMKVI